ncbi:MAG: hypothetical protein GYA86_05335 [Firmicutes bacterium]|jgi:hypothetical protein|nr:hypothetical protein [Bacillota bacterium]
MNILELLDGVIRKPAAALNQIAREKPVGWALAIFTAVALFGAMNADYSALEQIVEFPPPNILVQVAGSLVGLLIITGLLHLVSRLFKGSGDFWGLFSALGFAQFPAILNPVAELLKRVGGTAGAVLGGVLSLGVGIWVLVLWVIALRESRSITTGESVLTYLAVLFGFAMVILVIVVWGIFVLGRLL